MNVAGGGGGRTGPYWRRQLGMTLPGERTGAQLNLINALRAKAGQSPLGGPVGDNTREVLLPQPLAQRAPRGAHPQAPPQHGDLRAQLLQSVMGRSAIPENHPLRPGFEGGPTPFDEAPDLPGVQGMPQVHNDLRQLILDRFSGQAPMLTSRDALKRYVANQPGRVARPGVGRQPILPPRQARRAVPRPY